MKKKSDRPDSQEDSNQVLENLENDSKDDSGRVTFIEDPENPPLICFADVLGWVLGFFFLFAIYAVGHTIWSKYTGIKERYFGGNGSGYSQPQDSLELEEDIQRKEEERRLKALQDRLDGIGKDKSDDSSEYNESEFRESKPPRKKRTGLLQKLRTTISKDAEKSRQSQDTSIEREQF